MPQSGSDSQHNKTAVTEAGYVHARAFFADDRHQRTAVSKITNGVTAAGHRHQLITDGIATGGGLLTRVVVDPRGQRNANAFALSVIGKQLNPATEHDQTAQRGKETLIALPGQITYQIR